MVARSCASGVPSSGIRADERGEHVLQGTGDAAPPLTPYPLALMHRATANDRLPAQMPVPLARGTRGAVASPHHLATDVGIGALRVGGSAVDAAIATNAALAVVAGHSCGLGGDAFWLIADTARARSRRSTVPADPRRARHLRPPRRPA